MNASTLSSFSAGGGVSILSHLVRASSWAFKQFMHAPARNAGVAFLAMAMLVAANNALYRQNGAHPAPLFGSSTTAANIHQTPQQDAGAPAPLSQRPASLEMALPPLDQAQAQPGSAPALETGNIAPGNRQLAQVQQKLAALGLFSGKIDGYYGPVTARAIRIFEQQHGITPKGALDPEIMAQILGAANAGMPQSATADPVDHSTSRTSQPLPGALTTLVQSALKQTSQPAFVAPASSPPANPAVDKATIKKIQRGLASLGFLYGSIDGVAGQATARAIRNFEVYQNLEVTGRVSPDLVNLLRAAGASF